MATTSTPSMGSLGNVLVVGGCGFLGHHIVARLHSSYTCKISVLDLKTSRNRRPESDGVAYFDGDITDINALTSIFEKVKPDVVIHTASPTAVGNVPNSVFKKVNVDGTRCVIEACQKTNVKALVFTSSASIISDHVSDIINADERWPVITGAAQTSYYTQTKVFLSPLYITLLQLTPLPGRSRNPRPRSQPHGIPPPPNLRHPTSGHTRRRRRSTNPRSPKRPLRQ